MAENNTVTKVAYLGPAGTFTEIALQGFHNKGIFGENVEIFPLSSPRSVIEGVSAGEFHYGVVPEENSVDGSIVATSDALRLPHLRINGEIDVPIIFAAMIKPGTTDIHTFSTHPVAYAQLRTWISQNYPHARYVEAFSNGAAAESVAQGEVDMAFAPIIAAEKYGLDIIHEGLADYAGATTRFALVANDSLVPEPEYKLEHQDVPYRSMVILTLKNEPGSLVRALVEFSTRGIDLSRIESRPTRERIGTYHFLVDFLGHYKQPEIQDALRSIENMAENVQFLGSWPIGEQPAP